MNRKIHYSSDRGASSILVIIMMVVLLVFGLAVLTTSLSNMRLGERKKTWLSEYYTLEGLAAETIASYDRLLLEAEAETINYIASGDYVSDYSLPMQLTSQQEQRLFALVYGELVANKFSSKINGDTSTTLYFHEVRAEDVLMGKDLPYGSLDFLVLLPESSYDKGLAITMEIQSITPDNLTQDMLIEERYIISRHTQQQEPFELDESIDFDDPFEEDANGANPFGE